MGKENSVSDLIEKILGNRRGGVFPEQIADILKKEYNYSVSYEYINEIVKEDRKRFSYHSNGSIILLYEQIFWEIVDKIRFELSKDNFRFIEGPIEAFILFALRMRTRPVLLEKMDVHPKLVKQLGIGGLAILVLELFIEKSQIKERSSGLIQKFNSILYKEFKEIELQIDSIPDELFGLYFTELFRSANLFRAISVEPNSTVSEIIAALASKLQGRNIFDPFAGIGSFITELHKIKGISEQETRYYLSDRNRMITAYAKMNLLLNGVFDFTFATNDSYYNENNSHFDLVITNPPFNREKREKSLFEVIGSYLSKKGQALLIIPDSYLFNEQDKKEREMLLTKGKIRSIISLPPSLFKPFALVKTSIIHLDNNNSEKNQVLFINAVDLEGDDFRDYIPTLADLFFDRKPHEDRVQLVSIEDIAKNGFNLSAPLYFTQALYDFGNFRLSDVLSPIKSPAGSKGWIDRSLMNDQKIGFPVIQASSLSHTPESIYLNLKNVKNYTNQIEYSRLPDNTIVLTPVGPKLRPTLVDKMDKVVIDPRTVIPLQINTEEVLPEYLIYHLHDEMVTSQVQAYYLGVVSQRIRLDDLLKVRVYIPNIEEQRRIVKDKRRQFGIDRTQEQNEIAYERFSALKHSMAQPLRALSSDLSTLLAYLHDKEVDQTSISFKDYTAPVFDGEDPKDLEKMRLANVSDRMSTSVKYLQNSLQKVEALIKTSTPLEVHPVQLKALLEKVLEMNKDNTYSYQVKGPDVHIKADEFLLESAFTYLIENAVKHGFLYSQEIERNCIVAEIEMRKFNNVEIILKNNGHRIADGMESEHVFERGRTSDKLSGSGFGAFVVNEIIKKHMGTIELVSRPHEAFPVQFKINLPL